MSQTTEGAMAAIVNATREQIETLLAEKGLVDVDIANCNTPMQTVISGPTADIAACQDIFNFDKVMYVPLNTSGAFHSRLMVPAAKKFEAFLKKRKFSKPKIPVIANLTAQPYPDNAVVEYLSKQIHSPVLWSDSIHYLMSLSDEMAFVEAGHGDVLTKMILKIRQIAAKAAAPAAKSEAVAAAAAEPAPTPTAAAKPAEPVSARGDRFAAAERKVADWNSRHPVGTRVRSQATAQDELATRTPAVVLFGHRAAVYMEGFNGYFDLDELSVA
jgi:acyl transferase domain-containing protein